MHARIRSAALLASMLLALNCVSASAAGDGTPADAPATAKISVQVLGRVKSPGTVVLDSGARLSDALAAAGAFAIEPLIARIGGTPIVDTECTPGGPANRYVFLARSVDASHTPVYFIEIAAVRKHDARYDMLMQPNDKIFVPECHWLTRPHFPIPQIDSVRE